MGRPSIVGEKGAELFVPDVPGRILPADDYEAARVAMGGSATASDTAPEIDQAYADNTASIGSASVRMADRESGSASGPNGSTIKFETFSVGAMDVVTREEALKIGQESAAQARAQVFNDMRNRPAIRRQIGVK